MNKHNAQVIVASDPNILPLQVQRSTIVIKDSTASLKQLKASINYNLLKHVPQSPLKYFNQENNSLVDD
jgi:hypothetical protein